MAVGMAYAEYLKGTETRIYCVMSDGELQEGSTWEAARMAGQLKLDNLIVFVDANGYGGMEQIKASSAMFWDCGWETPRGINGHHSENMASTLRTRPGSGPCLMMASTIKGYGASFMRDRPIWHYKSPNAEELAIAMAENA